MEDTLGDQQLRERSHHWVLILVLMEDTLGDFRRYNYEYQRSCLNPCSNGRYSRRVPKVKLKGVACVLILVLMEDTLGEKA